MARRNELYVKPLVHVALALVRIIRVNVHRHRPVPVDAPSDEIRKQCVGYREGAERKALCRCEADVEEPVIEMTIYPLIPKPAEAMPPLVGRDGYADLQARTERFQHNTLYCRN